MISHRLRIRRLLTAHPHHPPMGMIRQVYYCPSTPKRPNKVGAVRRWTWYPESIERKQKSSAFPRSFFFSPGDLMQVRECAFRLPNGKQCRCAATRNQPFCRHHGPKPAVAGPPPIPANELYSRLRCWREMGREIPWLDPSEIPGAIDTIHYALLNDGISDLAAGRFLRALTKRLGCVPSQ